MLSLGLISLFFNKDLVNEYKNLEFIIHTNYKVTPDLRDIRQK